MSHQDSESESESDGSITPSSTSANDYPPVDYVEGRDCHHLGHLEAIPIDREGTLVRIHHAYILSSGGLWLVCNSNEYGPKSDFCYKLPGPGNSWIAKTTQGTEGSTELFEFVSSHNTEGYKRHIYERVHYGGDTTTSSWIIESYREEEQKARVPMGPHKVETLQERLGFDTRGLMGQRSRGPRRSNYIGLGDLWGAAVGVGDGDDESEEDDEDEDEDEDENRDEDDEDEDEDEDEEPVSSVGMIWQSHA